MKLPRSIRIDGTDYVVRGMPRDEKHKGLYGIMYSEKEGGPEIKINRNFSERQQALTVLHEVIHAVLLPLKLNSNHEESLTLRLEKGLASVLEENPTLARQLITLLRETRSPRTRSR